MSPRLAAAALALALVAGCSSDDGGESVDTVDTVDAVDTLDTVASDTSVAEETIAPDDTTESTEATEGTEVAGTLVLDDDPTTTASEATTPGDGGGSTGTSAPGDTPELCVQMEELANWNAVNEIDLSGDWPEAQAQLAEAGEESLVLYDEALAVLPEEPRAWLQTMRDWNDEFFAAVAEAESIDVISEFISDVPPGLESATLNFDGYLRDTCGFGLTQG